MCIDSARNERLGNIRDLHVLKVYTEKRRKILEWISPGDFSNRHKTLSIERVEKCGTWFLQSDVYQNWLNGKTSNVLCGQGIRKSI